MAFKDLYNAVQEIDGRVKTGALTVLAIEHSDIKHVIEMWSGQIDPDALRGSYIEGPLGPPVVLGEHEALIALSREMCTAKPHGRYWRRLVYTKELMHVFDTEEEKSDTEAKFDLQIQKFADPTLEMTPQFRSEAKAVWRAMMVLCQEERRQEFVAKIASGDITLDYIAAAIHFPLPYIHYLLQENYTEITAHLVEG